MSLQSDVVDLLRSREAQRINFRFASVPVYGSGFGTIADAVESGRIMVHGMVSRAQGALLCEYRHSEGTNHINRLLVDVGLVFGAPFEAQLVIHEATHALMDYHSTPLNLLESEAAGYIAGAFYCVVKRLTLDDITRSFSSLSPRQRDEEMVMVYTLAHGIAQGIAGTRGGYAVASSNVEDLKQTIARTRLYRLRATETVAYDGI